MDKKVANNTIVGIFVALGFVAFIFIVFNMGGGRGLFSSDFTVYGRFSHVKGLHTGSEIALSGLRIGVITDIAVAKDNTKDLIVTMGISKSLHEQVREDSTATIKTQGVLGDKYIEITIGSQNVPILAAGSNIKTSEDPDLFSKSGNLVEGITRQFNKGGDIEILLKNLTVLSGNLASISGDIKKFNSGQSLGKAIAHLEGILGKIESGEGTIGSLINDPTIYEDLRSMMGGAKRSTILKYFMHQFIEEGNSSNSSQPKQNKK